MGYFAYYIIDFPVKLRLLSDSNRNLQTIFFIIIIQPREGGADYKNPAMLQSTNLVALRITCQILHVHVHVVMYSHKQGHLQSPKSL